MSFAQEIIDELLDSWVRHPGHESDTECDEIRVHIEGRADATQDAHQHEAEGEEITELFKCFHIFLFWAKKGIKPGARRENAGPLLAKTDELNANFVEKAKIIATFLKNTWIIQKIKLPLQHQTKRTTKTHNIMATIDTAYFILINLDKQITSAYNEGDMERVNSLMVRLDEIRNMISKREGKE